VILPRRRDADTLEGRRWHSGPYDADAAIAPGADGMGVFARYQQHALLRDDELCGVVVTVIRGLDAYWFRSVVAGPPYAVDGVDSITVCGWASEARLPLAPTPLDPDEQDHRSLTDAVDLDEAETAAPASAGATVRIDVTSGAYLVCVTDAAIAARVVALLQPQPDRPLAAVAQ
jgi:hypothetical protein